MPISRREFESGELDLSLLLIGFFHSNPDYAYTVEELIGELVSRGVSLSEEEMRNALSSIEARGRIESKTLRGGVVYYIYSKPGLGFRV